MSWFNQADEVERIIELADGRVLFLPSGRGGRAYHVPDHRVAMRLDTQITWAGRVAGGAAMAAVLAAGYLEDWWLVTLVVPALLLPFLAEQVLLSRYPEANDPTARAEALAVPDIAGGWLRIVAAAAGVGLTLFLLSLKDRKSAQDLAQLGILVLAILAAIGSAMRQRRALREREAYRQTVSPDNKPIHPR